MKPILWRVLVLGLVLAGTAHAADEPQPNLYEPVRLQAGTWDVEITFFDPGTGAASGSARGVQVNAMLPNGHWVTNDLKVWGPKGEQALPAFAGHGVWGWDPVAKEYIDSWVDTNDGALRIDHGFWLADKRTMHWTALQPDGAGHSVNYRMSEIYERDDKRLLTFFQVALQSGRLVKMAEMKFTKRPADASR